MAAQDPLHSHSPVGDPWHAFGYLVAGVAFYGLLGWLADRWLGTSFLVAVGIVLGAVLGVYLTWARFRQGDGERQEQQEGAAARKTSPKNVTGQEKQ